MFNFLSLDNNDNNLFIYSALFNILGNQKRIATIETFRFKARTTTSTRFEVKFFRVFSKYRLPGKLHFTIFH